MKIDISEVPELQQPALVRELEIGATYAVVLPHIPSQEAITRLGQHLKAAAPDIRFLVFDPGTKFFKLEKSE